MRMDHFCDEDLEELMRKASFALQQFGQFLERLPQFDANGETDNPFADELYEEARQEMDRLQALENDLAPYAPWIHGQVRQRGGQLQSIVSATGRVAHDGARGEILRAEGAQARRYHNAERLESELSRLLRRIGEAIARAEGAIASYNERHQKGTHVPSRRKTAPGPILASEDGASD